MSEKSSRSRVVVRQLGGAGPSRRTSRKSTGLSRLKRSSYRQPRRKRRRATQPGDAKKSRRAASNRIMVRWVAIVLAAFALVCGVTLFSLLGTKPAARAVASGPETEMLEGVPSAPLDPEHALAMARQLLAAESSEEIEALIRPGRLTPAEALAHLETLPVLDNLDRDIAWLGTYDTLSGTREMIAVRDRPRHPRLMPFVPDRNGEWKIDFDAFAGHCEVPFEKLAAGEAKAGIVRTTFTPDHYFNGAFTDEEIWRCVELSNPGAERTFFAYYRAGSDQERALQAILDRTENVSAQASNLGAGGKPRRDPIRVMLELDPAAGGAQGQFEIVSVVADGWVMPVRRLDVALTNETAAAP